MRLWLSVGCRCLWAAPLQIYSRYFLPLGLACCISPLHFLSFISGLSVPYWLFFVGSSSVTGRPGQLIRKLQALVCCIFHRILLENAPGIGSWGVKIHCQQGGSDQPAIVESTGGGPFLWPRHGGLLLSAYSVRCSFLDADNGPSHAGEKMRDSCRNTALSEACEPSQASAISPYRNKCTLLLPATLALPPSIFLSLP